MRISGFGISAAVLLFAGFGGMILLWGVSDLPPVPLTEVERLRLSNISLSRELLVTRRDEITRQIMALDSSVVEVTEAIYERAGVSREAYDISLAKGQLIPRGTE